MVRKTTVTLGLLGSAVAAVGAWTLYQRATTPEIPATVVATVGDVELRRYPPLVTVETEADSANEAFRRLFGYINGANDGGRDIAMTAPVERDDVGTSIPMTAPVAVDDDDTAGPMTASATASDAGRTRMAFYLPSDYDVDATPVPTDAAVELVAVPERTLAVVRFSGRPTDDRVARERTRLLDALADAGIETDGDPFFMGYDAPWTLPVLRRNEVAVPVRSEPRR
jgi:hypothetical protein